MSNSKKRSKKHHHKKHQNVLPYLRTPLIFVLISMLVAIPVIIGAMHYAVNAVHKAQGTLAIDCYDIETADSNYPDKELFTANTVGVLSCNDMGLQTNVYYGINRVSMRDGVGMYSKSSIDGAIQVAGYSSGAFKCLFNAQIGDTIEFDSIFGDVVYKVDDIYVSSTYKDVEGKALVLCTSKDNKPFSYYADEKLFVVAKEVQ